MIDLEAIRARWAAATPGPWTACPYGIYVFGPGMEMVADNHFDQEHIARGRGVGGRLPTAENLTAIAAAPDDIAALLAEVERLRNREAACGGALLLARDALDWLMGDTDGDDDGTVEVRAMRAIDAVLRSEEEEAADV